MMIIPRKSTELARDVIEDGVVDPKESYLSRKFHHEYILEHLDPLYRRRLNSRFVKTRNALGSYYVYLYDCNHISSTVVNEDPSYRGLEGCWVK